jgi:hypothetical protein
VQDMGEKEASMVTIASLLSLSLAQGRSLSLCNPGFDECCAVAKWEAARAVIGFAVPAGNSAKKKELGAL